MQDDKESGAGWVFKAGSEEPSAGNPVDSTAQSGANETKLAPSSSKQLAFVSWSASEYIATPKNMAWFGGLAAGTIAVSVLVRLITKDYISVVFIVISGIVAGVFAARQPQTLEYNVDSKGIQIGPKFYPYNVFRAFSVAHEEALSFITLSPLKRFMPPIAIHYLPADEDKIVETLGDYLPYEEHKNDLVDNLSRRFRF